MRAKSLISTFFGDLAMPHGGKAWVETMSALLEPLGVSNRHVRTSLFRLVEEGWLMATRVGRRSYYELSDKGISQTSLAEKLIYYQHKREWDQHWTLVFIVRRPENVDLRNQLEQELTWIGFGAVAKHIYAHPTASAEVVAERVNRLGLQKNVICMRAQNRHERVAGLDVTNLDMAEMCFSMPNLKDRYTQFIDLFTQLDQQSLTQSSELNLLSLRLLLLDEYRRIILHDPHLPTELLPNNWVGDRAFELCKKLYLALSTTTDVSYINLASLPGDALLCDFDSQYASRFKQ